MNRGYEPLIVFDLKTFTLLVINAIYNISCKWVSQRVVFPSFYKNFHGCWRRVFTFWERALANLFLFCQSPQACQSRPRNAPAVSQRWCIHKYQRPAKFFLKMIKKYFLMEVLCDFKLYLPCWNIWQQWANPSFWKTCKPISVNCHWSKIAWNERFWQPVHFWPLLVPLLCLFDEVHVHLHLF